MRSTDSKEKALLIARTASDKKAEDVVILDMRKVSSFCDYFVILSAGSVKKTQAIADHIEDTLGKKKIKPHHTEGRKDGLWILLDYGDTIVHIFYEETRRFYDLERLWGDTERVESGS